MDDRELRTRIDAILNRYDREWWRYWAGRIGMTTGAAGLALGLSACPAELLPPGPDSGAAVQPVDPPPVPPYSVGMPPIDPGITLEYGVRPEPPHTVPIAMYAAEIEPGPEHGALPDLGVTSKYGVRPELKPPPQQEEVLAKPAYAVPPPDVRPMVKYGIPNDRPPDVGAVARYAVRSPRPAPTDKPRQ